MALSPAVIAVQPSAERAAVAPVLQGHQYRQVLRRVEHRGAQAAGAGPGWVPALLAQPGWCSPCHASMAVCAVLESHARTLLAISSHFSPPSPSPCSQRQAGRGQHQAAGGASQGGGPQCTAGGAGVAVRGAWLPRSWVKVLVVWGRGWLRAAHFGSNRAQQCSTVTYVGCLCAAGCCGGERLCGCTERGVPAQTGPGQPTHCGAGLGWVQTISWSHWKCFTPECHLTRLRFPAHALTASSFCVKCTCRGQPLGIHCGAAEG